MLIALLAKNKKEICEINQDKHTAIVIPHLIVH